DEPARVGLPLWRAESRQGRDEDDAVDRFHARREPLALRRRLDHAETVAEPGPSPRAASTNVPVPYVALASPGAKHPCPKRAACWSPATPAIGTRAPRSTASPITPDEPTTSGSTARSTPNRPSSSSSQAPAARSRSIVREAFVTSVTCAPPAVSFQTSQESIVPNASSRAGSSVRARIHSSFVAEK